jgi:hypothetical protein
MSPGLRPADGQVEHAQSVRVGHGRAKGQKPDVHGAWAVQLVARSRYRSTLGEINTRARKHQQLMALRTRWTP